MKKHLLATAAALAIGFGGLTATTWAADPVKETKAEKEHEKHEKEELSKMPAGARRALRTATEGMTDIDYFKLKVDGHNVFGATYVGTDKKHWEIRFDSEGKQLSKAESAADAAADAAAAAAAAAAAQKTKDDAAAAAAAAAAKEAAMKPGTPATPSVATPPGTPVGPVLPIPAGPLPKATAEEVAAGQTPADPTGFPLEAKERIASEIIGCKNVRYYTSTADGKPIYESEYDTLDKIHYRLRVQSNGRIFSKHEEKDEEKGVISKLEPIAIEAAPAAAKKMLLTETVGVKKPEFFKVTTGNKVTYEAAFAVEEGKTRHVRIGEDGKLLSKHDTGGMIKK